MTQTLLEAAPDISILLWVFFRTKSDFKTICFKKNQKILRSNSKRQLQNMVKRKMTGTTLEIPVNNLAQKKRWGEGASPWTCL